METQSNHLDTQLWDSGNLKIRALLPDSVTLGKPFDSWGLRCLMRLQWVLTVLGYRGGFCPKQTLGSVMVSIVKVGAKGYSRKMSVKIVGGGRG